MMSSWIKEQKKLINDQTAHANIISGNRGFRVAAEGSGASTPFFDIEDEHFVKIDLWQIGSAAIRLMSLFHAVTADVARTTGRSVLGFRSDFPRAMPSLADESNALLDEQRGSERYKKLILKMAQRAEASAKAGSKGK
jgi:hypothetical protein